VLHILFLSSFGIELPHLTMCPPLLLSGSAQSSRPALDLPLPLNPIIYLLQHTSSNPSYNYVWHVPVLFNSKFISLCQCDCISLSSITAQHNSTLQMVTSSNNNNIIHSEPNFTNTVAIVTITEAFRMLTRHTVHFSSHFTSANLQSSAQL
jgi:hypothetical protein